MKKKGKIPARLDQAEAQATGKWPDLVVMVPRVFMAEAVAEKLKAVGWAGSAEDYPGQIVEYEIPINPDVWKGIQQGG